MERRWMDGQPQENEEVASEIGKKKNCILVEFAKL